MDIWCPKGRLYTKRKSLIASRNQKNISNATSNQNVSNIMDTEEAKNAFLLLRKSIATFWSLITVKSVNSWLIKNATDRDMVPTNAKYSLFMDTFAKESPLLRDSPKS